MCARFTLTKSAAEIAEHFGLEAEPSGLAARFNIAPAQEVAAIRAGRGGERERLLEMRHWGLVPHWAKDAAGAARRINARSETAPDKPAFREALRRRRCLVPADGFYEWRRGARGAHPHHVALEQGELFAFAGLYERWKGEAGTLESVTILTRDATANVRDLHDRMPIIVDPEGYAAWLDPEQRDPIAALAAVPQRRGPRLATRPVSGHVNDVRNDDAHCLDPDAQLSLDF